MMHTRSILLSMALLGASVATLPGDARACGGCFAPPGAASVVTDHRMVLSLSTTQTTLWDQFQYSGMPEDFSWILPIRYSDSTRIELASDDFFTVLNNVMVPALVRPAQPPYPPDCVFPAPMSGGFADAATSADAPSDTGVVVLRQEVVGPYAVAVVRGTTGMGLRDWLRMNGYTVPSAVEPVIDYYLGLNMDFVALRLRSGKGINRMVPVRVTTMGNQPRLPLRMIAAGVGDRVGLSLTVFAPSRVEAMNFPNTQLADSDFTYDWAAPPGDLGMVFQRAFEARNSAMGNRVWLTESAMRQEQSSLRFLAERLPSRMPFAPDGGADAGRPTTAANDVDVAFMGIGSNAMVTRMRADLPVRMLDRDLDIAASDLGPRERFYRFGRELNRPAFTMCPFSTSDAGTDIGEPFSDGAVAQSDAATGGLDIGFRIPTDVMAPEPPMAATAGGGIRCSTRAPGERGLPAGALIAGIAAAAALSRRRARR